MGANTRRRRKRKSINPKRRRRTASIYRATRRRRRNPILHRKRHRSAIRSRRRYHRNPMGGAMTKLMTMVVGAAAAIVVTAVPNLIKAQSNLTKYGSQVAAALIGGFAIGKLLKSREKAFVWTLVGGSVIVAELLKTYVLSKVAPSLTGMNEYMYLPSPTQYPLYIPDMQPRSVVPTSPFD